MKFYYEGKLVRTSKTHEYKYGILNPETGHIDSCHGTYESAMKEHRRPIAENENEIVDCQKAIKAIESGKTYFDTKVCRRWYRVHLKGKDFSGNDRGAVSTWEHYIESHRKAIEYYSSRKIVELEARA